MIIREILDFLAPRYCVVCGRRLAVSEEHICTTCLWHLPRTNYHLDPYENELAKVFWGRLPVEKAAAWFFYKGHSEPSRIILDLKYYQNRDIGRWIGKVFSEEILGSTLDRDSFGMISGDGDKKEPFFEGIDYIVPVPLSWWHRVKRGYNQSLIVAEGVSETTGIPVLRGIIKRSWLSSSQTKLSHLERETNVVNAFRLTDSSHKLQQLKGKHVLLLDDVITTGSTIASCGEQLARIPDIKISIMCVGRTQL